MGTDEVRVGTKPRGSVDEVARLRDEFKDSAYFCIERRSMSAHRVGPILKCKHSEIDASVRAGGAAAKGDK